MTRKKRLCLINLRWQRERKRETAISWHYN